MRPARRHDTRTAVVWETLQDLATTLPPDATVLDVGGGTGGFAVRLAAARPEHGASDRSDTPLRVTVVDPSPDALAALGRRAAEAGVSDSVTGVQGDLADLHGLLSRGVVARADLVLCHGVLGLLEDPASGLATLAAGLADGGTLSLLVGQLHAAVLARAMAGHVRAAHELLTGARGPREERRFTAEEVHDLLVGAGLAPTRVQGVRVFADLVPGALLDLEPGAGEALADLERAAADLPSYRSMATQLHVLATA